MKEFQIEQTWSDGCRAWEYISTESTNEEEIKLQAAEAVKVAYLKESQSSLRWTVLDKPRPTIHICEYDNGKVKNGIRLKTKWR